MPSFTLAQLRTAIRELGDYDNSGVFTDALLTRFVNEAIAELHELVSDQFQGFYDKTATIETVAGTQTVGLPSDFYDLRALDWQRDTERHQPLKRLSLGETYRFQGRGRPMGYMLFGGTAPGTVRLFPIPDAVYTLRVTYEPLPTVLASDSDSIDCRNGWEDYLHQAALLRCDQREERPLGDRMALIERVKQRVIGSAAKRNSAEPEHLVDWGDGFRGIPLEDLL